MGTTLAFLRANPAVAGSLIFVAIAVLVFGVLAVHMTRSGLSLRPLVFLAVFLGIVAGPQVAFHLAQASGVIPKRDPAWTFGKDRPHAGWIEHEALLGHADGRFDDGNGSSTPRTRVDPV